MSKTIELPHNTPIELKPGKICPLMSGQVVPVSPGGGKIAMPNQVQMAPVMVPCQKEGCQWWSRINGRCVIQDLSTNILSIATQITQQRRIADTLEGLLEHTKKVL